MTQTDIPTWCFTFQQKLMAALDAAWAILEHSHDPAEIRAARDKAKAIGDLAAMARKVALMVPTPRGKQKVAETAAAGMAATQAVATVQEMMASMSPPAAPPVAAQAEHARRALDKLKGGRRGRL
ncbi:hypothetical protein [Caulobacter sp.]|uniref:hypothetical protein n=1 Tax=Caulobacter sp. TaxID=78 RepID=UPI003BB0C46A